MAVNRRAVILRTTGIALMLVGILIILQIAYTDIYASFNQRELQGQWNESTGTATGMIDEGVDATQTVASVATTPTIENTPAAETAKTSNKTSTPTSGHRTVISEKEPFARIVIPGIKLDAIVVEGVSEEALKLGPGHMEETAHPGEVGNMVVSGHRVTYSRPFYYLDRLKKGDPIRIHTTSKVFTYHVVDIKVVKPTDISVIQPTPDRTLTLTTCNPRFSARTRLIVVAKMDDEG